MNFFSVFLVFSSIIASGYAGCGGGCLPNLGGCCRPELDQEVQECPDPSAPVVCYEPYVRLEKKVTCEPHCDYECYKSKIKKVRYVPKTMKVKCVRYVPEYVVQDCVRYEPEYYYEECCNYVPRMKYERKEETVAKKFYKRTECKPCAK